MTSSFQTIQPVKMEDVQLTDRFWAPRRSVNRLVTLPSQYRLLEETGRLDNFRRAGGQPEIPFRGYFYDDSDVYKWLQAAVETELQDPSPELRKLISSVSELVEQAQQPNGYLNTYFMYERAAQRWTNLKDMHELYCAGHFIEAAVSQASEGQVHLLPLAERLAGHLWEVFGPGRREGAPGHPEVELALVKLYRATGEDRYLQLAQRFLDQRGRGLLGGSVYLQDHTPFRDLQQLAGHAVRALYLCAGAAEIYLETGETALRETLERLWERMVSRQMYVSGGVGSQHTGEAFGQDYDLPNRRAYAETCAAIASIIWNGLMLRISGNARYADLLEWTLYNAILPGISQDGLAYFYVNPLASFSPNGPRRQAWFDCACCPTNLVRLLSGLPGYFYGTSQRGVWVHQYAGGQANLRLGDGREVQLRQASGYPWNGQIELEVLGTGSFELHLRIPGWTRGGEPAAVSINGINQPHTGQAGTYLCLDRTWRMGDLVRLELPMPIRFLESHPYVLEDRGQVALTRGPVLYCLESADHPGVDLRDLAVQTSASGTVEMRSDLLGGIAQLHLQGACKPISQEWKDSLYRSFDFLTAVTEPQPFPITAVPYFAWANREPGQMLVWMQQVVS